jgi:5-methylcytosine-specific restriction endonuclease McrA
VFVSTESKRKCIRCGQVKPVDGFAWRRREKGQRDSFCRPCRAAYGKEHYEANRRRYIEQAAILKRARMLERTRYLIEFFAVHPCVDCGETDPVVLEFDHLRDKKFAIGPALSQKSWNSILDEMEKCEVVCANCHRRRTARRRGALRAVLTANTE